MPSADDELERRRERGRRSQAAFRKRQAQANRALEDQNRRLINGIQRAVDAVHGDERPELLNVIFDLAATAGLDTTRPRPQKPVMHIEDEDITINAATGGFIHRSRDPIGSASSNLSPAKPQRLDCCISWDPQHYRRVSLPPQDIIPYLGPGAKTFAGRLFWSVMEHAESGCKDMHPDRSTVVKSGLGHSKATQNVKTSFIQRMVKARLEYKKTGSISPEHASAAEDDLGMVLRNSIETDYRSRGKDPGQWLSCVAIEQRVEKIAGRSAFIALEKAVQEEGDAALQESSSAVKCRLFDTAVCFGDGPRWTGYFSSRYCKPLDPVTVESTGAVMKVNAKV
ncbi:hypothetical protein FALBO_12990 [Fusarium albosuccineum]|uniref:BZIP domain-containing protein n=1 Tax=Fusarium albosuccineum TaxID=1237068 RepID=A0A8H4L2X1_9HYPO|nr:hypothetical protein FALBO_12990 [Fusarium albosuccineum]